MIKKNRDGFTLIELLTVIAIIGILAAILIPAVGAAKIAAKKAQTKTQFSQWATAMSLFKQEYGYYPALVAGVNNTSPVSLGGTAPATAFLDALAAQKYTGGANGTFSAEPSSNMGNTKLLSFYSISNSDLGLVSGNKNPGQLQDAFGNTDIKMLVDTDGSGIITPPTSGTVTSVLTGQALKPNWTSTTFQAGVIFYSAGAGRSSIDIVYSCQ